MNNFLILRSHEDFRRGAGISLKQEAALFCALYDFLSENNLLATPLSWTRRDDWSGFEIRRNDLTDEGFAVIKDGLDRWMRAFDRRGKPENIKILLQSLDQVRNGGPNPMLN